MSMQEKRKIGLLVAVEMDSVFARYGTPGKTERRGGFDVFHYENEQYILYVIHSGIGEIAAAAAAQLLIDRYGVELIVNFGVVGGLTEEMAQTRTCVVTRVVHYDFDVSEWQDVERLTLATPLRGLAVPTAPVKNYFSSFE